MNALTSSLDDVLESFLLDSDKPGVLQRYIALYPAYAVELIDLDHEVRRVVSEELAPLAPGERVAVETALALVSENWPQEATGRRDLFAVLGPLDYGRLSAELRVPRQVIAAVRNRRAITTSIPKGFLRRMAVALGGSVDDLLSSIGASTTAVASYKAVERPISQDPVPFEQILIEARVPEGRRLEILADRD